MFIFSNAMKRITCSFVCLASTLLVMAQEYYERNFEFLGNDSSASIMYHGGDSLQPLTGEYAIPDSVCYYGKNKIIKNILQEGFYNQKYLTHIVFPRALEKIGQRAFEGCSNLDNILITPSIRYIAEDAFAGTNLSNVQVDVSNPHYDSRNNCNAVIESKTNMLVIGSNVTLLPKSITAIGAFAFAGRKELKKVLLPKNVQRIGLEAFADCEELTSVEVENAKGGADYGLTSIGDRAFSCCKKLRKIVLPSSLRTIGEESFALCNNLKEIHIPMSVDSIGSLAFYGCGALERITVDKNNSYYDSRNHCNAIIDTKTHCLITGCKNTIIPHGVRTIGEGAFREVKGLRKIIIPEGVEEIHEFAFYGCKDLEHLDLPSSVKVVDYGVFCECNNLNYVFINSSIPPDCHIETCEHINQVTLYVPKGCVEKYRKAEGWMNFGKITEMK